MTAEGFDALSLAIDYAERGWPALPVAIGQVVDTVTGEATCTKRPLTKHGHLDATTAPDVLSELFAAARPKPGEHIGVGVRPGSAGFVVLDYDTKHNGIGGQTFAAHVDEHGTEWTTARYRSASGALNVVVRKLDTARFVGNARAWPSCDVRADAGWIVAPGTTTPYGSWTWETEHIDGKHPLDAAALIPDGLWSPLASSTANTQAKGTAASVAEIERFLSTSPGQWDLRAHDSYRKTLDALRTAPAGGRHRAMQTCAASLIGAGMADHPTGVDELLDVWGKVTASEPPRKDEPWDSIAWAIGQEIAKGRTTADSRSDATTPTVPKANQPSTQLADDDDGDGFVDWVEVFAGDDHADAVVDGLLYPGRWTSLAAKAKAGKSALALRVGVDLANGRDPFTGNNCATQTVVYIDAEMGRRDVVGRFNASDIGPADLGHFHYSDARHNLTTPTGAEWLLAKVGEVGASVVVVDGLNGFVPGTEKDDAGWRLFYDETASQLKRAGVALLTLDNLGKDATLGPRGSSVKLDKPDAVFGMVRTDGGVKLTATHRRSGLFEDFAFKVGNAEDDRLPTYRTADSVWVAGTKECADVLDAIGLPVDVTSRAAQDALRFSGQGYKRQVILSAIRWRKQASGPTPASGTTPGTTLSPKVGNHLGNHSDDIASDQGEPPREPPGTTSPKSTGTRGGVYVVPPSSVTTEPTARVLPKPTRCEGHDRLGHCKVCASTGRRTDPPPEPHCVDDTEVMA